MVAGVSGESGESSFLDKFGKGVRSGILKGVVPVTSGVMAMIVYRVTKEWLSSLGSQSRKVAAVSVFVIAGVGYVYCRKHYSLETLEVKGSLMGVSISCRFSIGVNRPENDEDVGDTIPTAGERPLPPPPPSSIPTAPLTSTPGGLSPTYFYDDPSPSPQLGSFPTPHGGNSPTNYTGGSPTPYSSLLSAASFPS